MIIDTTSTVNEDYGFAEEEDIVEEVEEIKGIKKVGAFISNHKVGIAIGTVVTTVAVIGIAAILKHETPVVDNLLTDTDSMSDVLEVKEF